MLRRNFISPFRHFPNRSLHKTLSPHSSPFSVSAAKMAPTPTPTPIRTALVGLTARPNVYDWGGSVHLAYITSSPHYELTAICNSSVSAAAAAKEKYHLPPTVKTYGSPADLAADADVDLVVVVVRASRHRDVAMPSLAAGKMVFVEWPLGRNVAEAEEMQALAAAKGLRTMVGLQSRQTGVFNKVKELLDAGKLGKVLSTSLSGAVLSGGGMEDSSIAYALDENSGSTFVDVHFAHCEFPCPLSSNPFPLSRTYLFPFLSFPVHSVTLPS